VAALNDKNYGKIAKDTNSALVYGKEIIMVADVSDKDDRGRLLRYVLVGDKFINRVMIQQGLGTALDVSPDSACAQTFKQAEQSAGASTLGVWSLPVHPNTP
jgi:endonuclease YncB( thermonuclease family)